MKHEGRTATCVTQQGHDLRKRMLPPDPGPILSAPLEAHGRYRYYRLAGLDVGRLIEALQQLAPAAPVRSLREGTRAQALRRARTCYDHLAGQVGVALMAAMLQRGYVTGGDGTFRPETVSRDKRIGHGHDLDYQLSPAGQAFVIEFGVALPPRRPVVRYCVDWSEQRHHLAGGLGRGLLQRLLGLDWIRRVPAARAVRISDAGHAGLNTTFGIPPIQ